MKMIPEILTQASGWDPKDGITFIEIWKTRGGKSLGRKLRSLF